MIPATEPRSIRESARLLVVESSRGAFHDARITDLPELLRAGDLLVLNDAATLPASLRAHTSAGGPIEIRLVRPVHDADWHAALLGDGDWRIPTELRDPPAKVSVGELLQIGENFAAEVVAISGLSDRFVTLRFNRRGPDMWTGIYAYGRPIQYSHLKNDLALWSVQTAYASRPWAMEMPSAGQPLAWSILLALKRRGVRLSWLTHAAGLSAAGDEELDGNLPMTESFEIPQATIDAIEESQQEHCRVIAIGTTVVRALEGSALAHGGKLVAGRGETDLIIERSFHPRIAGGLLTGLHGPAQSHFRLLRAFAAETTLRRAWRHAMAANYLCHEFGDLCLILQ